MKSVHDIDLLAIFIFLSYDIISIDLNHIAFKYNLFQCFLLLSLQLKMVFFPLFIDLIASTIQNVQGYLLLSIKHFQTKSIQKESTILSVVRIQLEEIFVLNIVNQFMRFKRV